MHYNQERRFQPRVAYAKEIWIGQDGIFSRTSDRIGNISVSGIFVETAQIFAVGSIVNLRFPLGDAGELVSCSATVINTSGHGLGMHFIDLPPEARSKISSMAELRANTFPRSAKP